MKKLFSKIALPLMLAAAVCIQPVSAATDKVGAVSGATEDTASEAKALAEGFLDVLENDGYVLALREDDGNVSITDKKTGAVRYTNPLNADGDSLAAGGQGDLLKSQLTVEYYQDEDNVLTKNSYADCIKNSGLSYTVENDTLCVKYTLGDISFDPDVIPTVLSKDRMEEILSKLSEDEQEEILSRYKFYEKDKLEKEVLEGLELVYPSIKDHDIYVKESIPSFKAEAFYALFVKAGYTTEDLQKDCDDNGIENPYEPKASFVVTLEYKLTADGFSVTVDPEKIEYIEDFKPVKIDILPYFAAADTSEKGFMLVPDGSGSIINLNNNKYTVNSYEKYLFENDYTSDITENIATSQESTLPVFALSCADGGFLATVDSGYEEAGIAAGVAGKNTSYNNIYPYFDLVSHSKISYGVSSASNVLAMTESFISCALTVSYHLLDEYSTYSELAVMYRGMLQESGLLPKESKSDNVDLNVELIASAHVQKRFLGIPYETIVSMTDYEQAAEILGKLDGLTTEVNYTNAFAGGSLQKTLKKFKLLGVLGSKKERKALSELTERLTFSYNAQYAAKVKNSDTAKKLDRSNAKVYRYDLVGKNASKSDAFAILSPAKLALYAKKAVKSFNKYDIESVNILDLGSQLNSDFKVGSQIDRYQARLEAEKYLSALSEDTYVSVKNGAIYSFNYIDKITEIPVTHTGYKIEDYAVPFYQIVVSGVIPYASASVNCADEGKTHFLKTVEVGAQLQYTWYYEKPDDISKTSEDYYGMSYAATLDEAKAYAESYQPLYEKIAGKAIVDHSYVSDTLSKTVYENGITVYVNYSDNDISVAGTTVGSKDFAVIGG